VEKFRRGARILLERIEDFDRVNDVTDSDSGDDNMDDNVAEYKFSALSQGLAVGTDRFTQAPNYSAGHQSLTIETHKHLH
jgi:hypothetical protein